MTQCVYDTRKRSEVTLGGPGVEDEMCVAYLHYYPAINLEVCKSCVSKHALAAYSLFLNGYEQAWLLHGELLFYQNVF